MTIILNQFCLVPEPLLVRVGNSPRAWKRVGELEGESVLETESKISERERGIERIILIYTIKYHNLETLVRNP